MNRNKEKFASKPVSSLGGKKVCETEFVEKSFTQEELVRTEENVEQWLLSLDEKIENFNNKEHIKNHSLSERLSDETPHARFEAILPVEGPLCKSKLSMFGTQHDTEKPVCIADARPFEEGCNMISIGSNNQWDTELGMHKMTNCKVHTFDCSSQDTRPDAIKDRTDFYQICIGPNDETDSHGRRFLSWNSTLQVAGLHHSPEYLKMDIEGFEYGVLRSLLRSKSTALPNQIAMEIHESTWKQPIPSMRHRPEIEIKDNRSKDVGDLLSFFLQMYTSGYRLSYVDHETHCGQCLEVLWTKIYC
jgi:hypothetical protein